MVSQCSAVTLDQGTFDVDANGQATYRLPLQLPPGIAGHAPELALVYNHRSPNDLLGVGWSLSGLSAITRTKATYAVDGFNGAISYGPDDHLAIDGQRLINVEGTYGAGGTVYFTEVQTWQRVVAGPTPEHGFTVTTKDGQTLEYGKSASSRILATGTSLVRTWAVNAETDRNGNRIEFEYTSNPGGGPDSGTCYIDAIRYTKRDGLDPQYVIQFQWEERPDVIVGHTAGYGITMAYRLKRISVSLAGGEVIRTHALDYDLSKATCLSRITAITESGAQSAGSPKLPPTTILWQDVDAPGFDIGPESVLDQHLGEPDVRPMDLRGSGRTDCVQLWFEDSALNATTYLATAGPHGLTFERAHETRLDTYRGKPEILAADVDGNGLTDLVVAYRDDNKLCFDVFLSDGTGRFTSAGTFRTGNAWERDHIRFLAVDANGDGRTDIVESYGYSDSGHAPRLHFRSYLSKFGDDEPNAMFTEGILSPTDDPANPGDLYATWAMDLNGDGMIDIVRVWRRSLDSPIIATAYLSVSKSLYDVAYTSRVETDLGTIGLQGLIGFQPVDVNGDGVQDLIEIWREPGDGTTTLHLTAFLSNGAGGFVPGPDSTFPHESLTRGAFYPMDVDGQGLTAIVGKWISGDDRLKFTVFRAAESGRYHAPLEFDAGKAGLLIASATFVPCDANGDGKADLVRATHNEHGQIVLVPYLSAGMYPDVASTITNQLGGVVELQYAPLSDSRVYGHADVAPFPGGQGCRFPNPMTPAEFPVQAVLGRSTYVVSQYTQKNDAARNRFPYANTTRMSYAGAQLNLLGRGWQGFRTVASLSTDNGRRVVRTFNQQFPYTGTSASTAIEADGTFATDPRVPAGATSVRMTFTSSEYEKAVRAHGAGPKATPIEEVLKKSSRHEQYDYGTFDYAIAQAFGYDDYGNETLNVYLGYVDTAGKSLDPSEVVYKYRRYQNDRDAWALGFLIAAKDSSNALDSDITTFRPGDYHLEIRTWTASTYNVKTRAAWDSSNSVFLTATYDYDEYGNRISESTPGNFVTTYDYDPLYHAFRMRSTSPKDAQGTALVTAYGYDPRFGVQVANCDPNGIVTLAALDGFGRIAARQGPLPAAGVVPDANLVTPLVTGSSELRHTFREAVTVTVEQTSFVDDGESGPYSEMAALQSFPTDAARHFVRNRSYVDGRARERETMRESGQSAGKAIVLTDYDADDKVTMKSLPFFSTTAAVTTAPHAKTIDYDVLGRPLVQNIPAGPDGNENSVTTWTYGAGGRVTQVAAAGSPAAYTQIFEHHLYNLTDKVRRATLDPGGANATSQFAYDAVTRLLRATDPPTSANPGGVSNTVTYDSLDRRLTLDNPDQNTTGDGGIKAMTYAYDAATGWLHVTRDAAGDTTTYGYDHLGRMTSRSVADGRTFVYTYDTAVNGRNLLARVVAKNDASVESQYDFAYDPYANISSTTIAIAGEASPFVTTAAFDPQKRVVRQMFPDATVLTRTYSFGQLVAQSLDGATIDYPLAQYSPWEKPGKLLCGNNVVSDFTFDPAGLLIDEAVAGAAGPILHYGYSYDLLSQLLVRTDFAAPAQRQAFTYANGRLATADIPGFGAASYDYDASGNLREKDGVTFTYRAHYPTSGTAGGRSVYAATPDACGRTKSRTLNDTTITFDYDGLGFLRRVCNANGETIREMVSNYLARLLKETSAGEVTLCIDPAYVVTRHGGGASTVTKYLLDDRGTAASIVQDGPEKTILYFRSDLKGSNTHAFDAEGTVVTQLAYDGYGQLLVVTGTDEIRRKYEHREWDSDLGLYDFGARHYDVFTGRFLTPDSGPGADDLFRADALNRFAFELNNPINHVDPTGNSSAWILGVVIGVGLIMAGGFWLSAATVALETAAAAAGVESIELVSEGVMAGSAALGWGGTAGIVYSVAHREESGWSFWKGFLISTVGGAASGAMFVTPSVGIQVFAVAVFVTTVVGAALPRESARQFMSDASDANIGGDDDASTGADRARDAARGASTNDPRGTDDAAAASYRYLKLNVPKPGRKSLEREPELSMKNSSRTKEKELIAAPRQRATRTAETANMAMTGSIASEAAAS